MKNKENIIKAAFVVGIILICIAACLITFYVVSGQVKESQESSSELTRALSKYDYSSVPDANLAGNYKVASATVTDKFDKKYNVAFKDFELSLNSNGYATCLYQAPHFSSETLDQIEKDNQSRIDALGESEKNELNKEIEAYSKETEQSHTVISGSQSRDDSLKNETKAKYKLMNMVNSDASIGDDIFSFGVNYGEWRNTDSSLIVAGENSFQEFSIEADGTIVCKIGNVDVVLKKA